MKSYFIVILIVCTYGLEITFHTEFRNTTALSNDNVSKNFLNKKENREYCDEKSFLYYKGINSNMTNITVTGEDFHILNITSTSCLTSFNKLEDSKNLPLLS
jgi:hypothetical protein